MSATKMGENSQYFKTPYFKGNLHFGTSNYLHVKKEVYFLLTVFIWSSVLKKFKEDSYGPKYTISILSLSEKKRLTNLQM